MEAADKYGYDFTKIQDSTPVDTTKGVITMIIYKKHGAIVTDTPFFSQLSEGIEIGCRKNRYILNIKYIFEGDDVDDVINEIIRFGNKGIILLGTEMQKSDFKIFKQKRIFI